ncbi:MAG: hypothetical protein HZY75_03110 [Nocardioidaceae bacterium]|nr:MAG: hypothetical protein HZY75_03110 [Nocardioidaceae bacterium]
MSSQRDELHEIIESLDDDGVRRLLAVAKEQVKELIVSVVESAWPPGWFNVGTAGRSDIAINAEELLAEGFGCPR